MGILSKTGSFFGHFFNFRVDKWIGLSFLKSTSDLFVSAGKELLKVQKEQNPEDFANAVERLSLSEAELKALSNRHKYFALIFLGIAFLVLLYGIFLYIKQNTLGSIMTFSLLLYVLTQAFRYHFWHMQIETHKLGCSIKEWLQYLFSFTKPSRES